MRGVKALRFLEAIIFGEKPGKENKMGIMTKPPVGREATQGEVISETETETETRKERSDKGQKRGPRKPKVKIPPEDNVNGPGALSVADEPIICEEEFEEEIEEELETEIEM